MSKKIFDAFIFFCLCLWSISGVFGVDEVSVSVTEGDSVTLNSDLTEIQRDDLIMWRTHNNNLIAKIQENNYKTDFAERFRDRLKLDHQTGSLTIMNTRTNDSGLYTVKSSRSETPLNTFNLTVYARLPVPVISHSSKKTSSSSYCSLVCSSVLNVCDATLSWYTGFSVLSSISVCDLNISLSLPLEIECLNDSYSCVINNTISNQTTHLNTELCHPCSGSAVSICWCSFTEAVIQIRMALSAVVGVATVAVLVYEFRSRSLQQKKKVQTPSNSD